MAKLTDVQIATVARAAGFRGNEVAIATGIAIAESRGETTAHNGNRATGDDSYGLWQINMLGGMGPERRKRFGLKNNEALYDPATNGKVAYGLYKSRGGWGDWSTYNKGLHLLYMPRAQAAAIKVDPDAPLDTILPDQLDSAIQGAQSTVQSAEKLIAFVTSKDNWLRVAMFAGGVLLAVIALLAYVKNTQAMRTAVDLGKQVIPIGRAVKSGA